MNYQIVSNLAVRKSFNFACRFEYLGDFTKWYEALKEIDGLFFQLKSMTKFDSVVALLSNTVPI